MPNHSFLKDYADRYDTFYKDKDYKAEAKELDKIFALSGVETILDIACGTGRHMVELEKLGYKVKGTDLSPMMISIATSKKLDVSVCAMQDLKYNEEFDAAICLFAAFDYLVRDTDIELTMDNVYKALKPGGIFVFDFWNKPVVEKEYMAVREGNGRISFTTLKNNTAKIQIYFGGQSETHFLRYHDPEDVRKLLHKFTDIEMTPFNGDWSIQVKCLKPQS
jgi:SAM-dependent methyltransferase